MIVTETVYIGEQEFVRTYSDAGLGIVCNGISYTEAIDPVGSDLIYTEGEANPNEEPHPDDILEIILGNE